MLPSSCMTTRSLLSFLPGELLPVWPFNTADYVATLPLGLLDFLAPSSAAFTFTLSSACQEFVLQAEMTRGSSSLWLLLQMML